MKIDKKLTKLILELISYLVLVLIAYSSEAKAQESFFECPRGWKLRGLDCYQFFNIRHSWQKASELCKRYGSDLASVESYRQNNFTASLAKEFLSENKGEGYWLGLQAYNRLQTNTLEADAGHQISQYYGHWALTHPDVDQGNCVRSTLHGRTQEWELTTCEELLPFVCQIPACPAKTYHCSNGQCINSNFVCDGENDCGDNSDELNCPNNCKYHLESSGDIIESYNYPNKYTSFSNCKWTLEGPRGTTIVLQFSEFETEKNFDTVQILGGGRTEESAVNIDTLSGELNLQNKTFVSASNFMIIKFRTDGSVEKKGFRASWRTETQDCGGELLASNSQQFLSSPNYPKNYPGGLECLYIISSANPGGIISLEIMDLELEPDKDYVLIRDGQKPTDAILATLTGSSTQNPKIIVSTGNKLYVYTRTDQADSRRGYRIKYYEGCDVILDSNNGTISSPGFPSSKYPNNVKCHYRIRNPGGGRMSLLFDSMDIHSSDVVQVFDGAVGGLRLHPANGFTGSERPKLVLSAQSGEMSVLFISDSLQNGKGFSATLSADCPPAPSGEGVIASSFDTVYKTGIKYRCPPGQYFATGVSTRSTYCSLGGIWRPSYVPKCQPVYCGSVPVIDNGFAVDTTNVTYRGVVSYQCYAGFAFSSGQSIEKISCDMFGKWTVTPDCTASQCPPLPEVEFGTAVLLNEQELHYGTVVRYECNSGYIRVGLPVLLCQSNGTWSSSVPSCLKKRCFDFPKIQNGLIVTELGKEYYFGDSARVDCHRGYSRIGSNIITCGENQSFVDVPSCEDKNECDLFQCDFTSTECENTPGLYHCKCRAGFEPNLECRPVLDLGVADGGIPNDSIFVSGSEEGYSKENVRLNSDLGWCGNSDVTGTNTGNWIMFDFKAPSILRGFRTRGVQRLDGTLAYPLAIRLLYTNDLSDKMREFRNFDESPVEFRVLDGNSMSVMNLPEPIEARYIRLNILNYTVAPCVRLELMGCQKQSCNDNNECLKNNGGCQQKCLNNPGSFNCMCNVGFELFTENGTSNYYIAEGETGTRDGDLFRLNKTCVPKSCTNLEAPSHGTIITEKVFYRFGDMIHFMCNFGYLMEGNPSLLCTSAGTWNGSVPTCQPATCETFEYNEEGLRVESQFDDKDMTRIPFMNNVTLSCGQPGLALRKTATSAFRSCVYNPLPDQSLYWLSGANPSCPRIDCGPPPLIPGADYGDFVDTKYKASFFFGCKDEAFRLAGQSSKNDNIVRCLENEVWDFGNMRCEGPVCEDPLRPPDGLQISESYEQGSFVSFKCTRPGYIPINPAPIECVEEPECKIVRPLGISSGKVPDSAINATSERGNYEARNIRLHSSTGWCGKKEAFTYVNVDLNSIHRIKAILVKGVITEDVVGRPTEIRFFYKEREEDNYVVYFPNFNLTARDPGNYGELAMITLPLSVTARFVILGIVSYDRNPCLKFELMGCEVSQSSTSKNNNLYLGFDNGYPICVDNEPPAFTNCPTFPIEVRKEGPQILPINFTEPFAKDNSGSIARMEIYTISSAGRTEGFSMPFTTFEDIIVEYYAYDYDGNVAICQINITVPDTTPPLLSCPQSFVIELVDEEESYEVDFTRLRNQVNTTSEDIAALYFIPEKAKIATGSFENVTVKAIDEAGNEASCYFQVAIKPSRCVAWELKAPENGNLVCESSDSTGLKCLATCKEGFRFTDGSLQKTFSCFESESWSPSNIVQDCVSENTTLSTYDVSVTVTYRGNGAIPENCLDIYSEMTRNDTMSMVLTERCTAGSGVSITVSSKPGSASRTNDNMVDLIYTYMVSPSVPQPRVYDICGQTHDLLFDLSIQRSNALLSNILEIPSTNDQCPGLRALSSSIARGFVCEMGQVLNTLSSSEVPRCLDCPAGFFARRGEDSCSPCPLGTYQNDAKQGVCTSCPLGTWTLEKGSKTKGHCIPVCGYGTYSPSGLVPCLECPRNSYSGHPPQEGFKECLSCPSNTFTFQPGSKILGDCRDKCSPGSYSDTGLSPCAPCPHHHFQPLSGQAQCFECHSTEETFLPGASSKDSCRDVGCLEGSCEHGGLCVAVNHRPKCFCPSGFSGERCEINVDECSSSPCYNGATCLDKPQGFSCICPEGYSGLQCGEEISDCDSEPCPGRSMCRNDPGPGNFTCLCRTGYTGENCEDTLDPCLSNPCAHDARCEAFQHGRFVCHCPPGWSGTLCTTNIDDCSEQPCLLGANCTDLIHDFSCDCPNGFRGKTCEIKVDLCAGSECLNGRCIDKYFRYECLCTPGWTGPSCEINIDDCSSSPCDNNGQCIDEVNDYKCICDSGFTGKRCQHTIDYCSSKPCQNGGTCSNSDESFLCDCRPGFVGLTCEGAIDECASNLCDPAGTSKCLDLDNRFECECRNGYTGDLCNINIEDCASNPCLNGASCKDQIEGFTCSCFPGWTGSRCENDVDYCESQPCEHDAKCINLFQDFFCVCPSGTDGKRCETAPERCIGNPCLNGGFCRDFGQGVNCSCPVEYTGAGCEVEFDACDEEVCMNGATCVDNGRDYTCTCPPGFTGQNCDVNINDCLPGSCPPAATCIDLTNDFYCRCPFNLTGEDCRKTIQVDYDLHFTDESKSSSASLAVPFLLGGSGELTIALWVQFDVPGETGTYFTLYSVKSEFYPNKKRVLAQAVNSGIFIHFFEDLASVFLQFPAYVPIANGQWHHVAVTWTSTTGTLTLVSDGLIADKRENYGVDMSLPMYGYVTLGSTLSDDGRQRTESGFHGKLTRVQIWQRTLDPATEIPRQVRSCRSAQILFPGLILRWAGYDVTVGGVERIMPSICGSMSCSPGYSGADCQILEKDKIPPRIEYCPPGDIWIATSNGSAYVNWDEPLFADNVRVDRVINKGGLKPGQALQWGTYDVAYVAYDEAGNTAQCDFKIYVLDGFCPPLDPPIGGSQSCEDWGPGGRFKICRIQCDDNLKFSTKVPQFYTCGAEGFWRPNPNPDHRSPFVYPSCSKTKPAQKIFKIKLDYLTNVLCNEAGKGVLRAKIIRALQELNKEWNFSSCNQLTEKDCESLGINVNCNPRRNRVVRRQIGNGGSGSDEQAYQLEIRFPTIDTDEVTNDNGQRERLQKLIESVILEQNKLDVNDTLPNVLLDKSSISIGQEFSCVSGQVVSGNQCVPCPQGSFFESGKSSCSPCPLGTYSKDIGQLECQRCPDFLGKPGATESLSSTSIEDCKERCPNGQYFDKIIGLCRPCGYGKYQPEEGKFSCRLCGVGLTTRTKEAVSVNECREECADGKQLGGDGNCESCPLGTYRSKGLHLACERCPEGFTTSKFGSSSTSDCLLPICAPGSYLNSSLNECLLCPRGSYQNESQQTNCIECEPDTSTEGEGATSVSQCTNRCRVSQGQRALCGKNANCLFIKETNSHICTCKTGYSNTTGDGSECVDNCLNFCRNEGSCLTDKEGNPYCHCIGSFGGPRCDDKSTFVYLASGIAGAVVFLILLALLIWMICVRATRTRNNRPEKILTAANDANGSQVNFYYGAPAPYAESIAPSHHSTYAHYYDDEEDGWEMPNFYNETYMKDGLHSGNKMNSLARSNASLYGNKDDLYDRLRRHAYQGKKTTDKSGNETTSESDGQ